MEPKCESRKVKKREIAQMRKGQVLKGEGGEMNAMGTDSSSDKRGKLQ